MNPFDDTTNLVALLLLLARLGDIGSTYLVTPTLKLEGNPVARRFRWPFAVLTLFAAAIPYYSLPMGAGLLVASLLTTASNLSGAWLVRTMGESEYHDFVVRLAAQTRPASALLFIAAQAICIGAISVVFLHLSPNSDGDLGNYAFFGFFVYALAVAFWGSLTFVKYHKEGRGLLVAQVPLLASGCCPSRTMLSSHTSREQS